MMSRKKTCFFAVYVFLSAVFCSSLFAEDHGLISQLVATQLPTHQGTPKKILVLSCQGGYGHTAATNTLIGLLGNGYEFVIYHPIDQVCVLGIPLRERFYNTMIHQGWIRTMNFVARHIAPGLFRISHDQIEGMIGEWIEAEHPDLVISVIPYVNYPAIEAARKKGVPYLLITTDNDLRNWINGLDHVRHPEFKVTIGADLPLTRGLLLKHNIPNASIETVGLPLRPDFMTPKDEASLRKAYQISPEKTVVLIMMGGSGAGSTFDYASKIAEMDLSLHLIVCAGKNEKLKTELEGIPLHPSNAMTVLGFTDKIADLMAFADLIITKPGPGTINEAIAMQLPVLVDNTSTSLYWERVNSELVVRYGIGDRIRNYKDIKKILKKYLKNAEVKESVDQAFAALPPNHFHQRIRTIIETMCSKHEHTAALSSSSDASASGKL
jgi:processive 1,2-diacylglycerol beta-glucosyltransferase